MLWAKITSFRLRMKGYTRMGEDPNMYKDIPVLALIATEGGWVLRIDLEISKRNWP